MVGLEGGKPLEISLVANSSNAEVFNMTEDNQIHINLPVIVETNIILRGYVLNFGLLTKKSIQVYNSHLCCSFSGWLIPSHYSTTCQTIQ